MKYYLFILVFFTNSSAYSQVAGQISIDLNTGEAKSGTLVLWDDFSNNNNKWFESFKEGEHYVKVENSHYRIECGEIEEGITIIGKEFKIDDSRNYYIEFSYKVAYARGHKNPNINILFGYKNLITSNNFIIDILDKKFKICRVENNNLIKSTDWINSSAIGSLNDFQKVKIVKAGDEIYFYINGVMVNNVYVKNYPFSNTNVIAFKLLDRNGFIIDDLSVGYWE